MLWKWLKIIASLLTLLCLGLGILAYVLSHPPGLQTYYQIETSQKVVSLTFDDGPNPPYTEDLLDILDKYQVKATFFFCGEYVQQFPETVERVREAGHTIGNHAWNYKPLCFQPAKQIKTHIEKTDSLLSMLGVPEPILFRPPYGLLGSKGAQHLRAKNRLNIMANVMGYDWMHQDQDEIVDQVMTDIRPGSIIVLHDGFGRKACTYRGGTVAATDRIISGLLAENYQFLSVPELIAMEGQ